MNITFGKKIPIAKGQILDKRFDVFVPVTCYEYDCKDKGDIEEIKNLDREQFYYQRVLLNNMAYKLNCFQHYKENNSRFYNLEKENGEILAIVQAEDTPNSINVKFLETKRDKKHKYAGQFILAALGKTVFNERKYRLVIKNAVKSANDFYEKICKFRPIEHYSFEANRFELKCFIRRTEKRINARIIDIEQA